MVSGSKVNAPVLHKDEGEEKKTKNENTKQKRKKKETQKEEQTVARDMASWIPKTNCGNCTN